MESVRDLSNLSVIVLERSREITYKAEFPWMDFIRPVTDNCLLDVLRGTLIDQMLSKLLPSALDILLPDDLARADDGFAIEYVLLPNESTSEAQSKTFTIRRMALWVASKDPDERVSALHARLRFVTVDREEVGSASLLECLSTELTLDGNTYVVDDGNFYCIDPDFLAAVADDVSRLSESSVVLPCYRGGTEG